MRVGIVYGGTSSEAKISEKNASAIEAVLRAKGYEVCMMEYCQNMVETIRKEKIDIVYLCVQGKYHGDGTLQGMLDHEQIPYTGSSAHAAMLINDKILCKFLFDYYGIPTPKWRILRKEEYIQNSFDFQAIGFPFVAKAPSQGGSFGIELIRSSADLEKLAPIFQYDDPILLEEFVDGRFYTVGLFEKDGRLITLDCVEGVELDSGVCAEPKNDLILFQGDYDIRKPQLTAECLQGMEQIAEKVFRVTGAKGVARVDFMVSGSTGRPSVLEINAVPGLKRGSLLPKAAEYSGVQYEDLIESILLSAWSGVTGGKKIV